MRRRQFIALIGGGAAWPLAARAQQPERMRRIGILTAQAENDPAIKGYLAAFTKELNSFGWSEGRNLRIEIRMADRGAGAAGRADAAHRHSDSTGGERPGDKGLSRCIHKRA